MSKPITAMPTDYKLLYEQVCRRCDALDLECSRLEQRNDALEAALVPFAHAGVALAMEDPEDVFEIIETGDGEGSRLHMSDYQMAAKLMEGKL